MRERMPRTPSSSRLRVLGPRTRRRFNPVMRAGFTGLAAGRLFVWFVFTKG